MAANYFLIPYTFVLSDSLFPPGVPLLLSFVSLEFFTLQLASCPSPLVRILENNVVTLQRLHYTKKVNWQQ